MPAITTSTILLFELCCLLSFYSYFYGVKYEKQTDQHNTSVGQKNNLSTLISQLLKAASKPCKKEKQIEKGEQWNDDKRVEKKDRYSL